MLGSPTRLSSHASRPSGSRATVKRLFGAGMAACLLAACGGSGSDDAAPEDGTDAAATTVGDVSGGEAATETVAPDAGDAADYTPGDISYRVVNTLAEPVDLYVRTSGLVEAFLIEEGVAPGAVTDFAAPPTDGVFLVTRAGATDPTCVIDCTDFIAQLSTIPDDGPFHTVVLYDDEFSGASSFDLWEDPIGDRTGSANAMVPADPETGQVVVTAIAVRDDDFGLRLSVAGASGCAVSSNLGDSILIGGNQTPAFSYSGASVDVSLHANDDRECATPLGDPFTIDGGPGARAHLILTGTPSALDGIVVPMAGSPESSATDDGSDSDGSDDDGEASSDDDRDLAIELMTVEVESNLGLTPEQSACAAVLLVDAIGPDVLLDGGQLVELDSLPVEFDEPASLALAQAITDCDIDPDSL